MKIASRRSRVAKHVGEAPDENVEVVLEQKQHKIISYDKEDKISSVVVTGLPVLLGESSSSNVASVGTGTTQAAPTSSVKATIPTPPKKHYVRTNDIRSRNIEARPKRTPTNRRRHRVSESFSSSVGRPPRDTYQVTLQQKARSDRYEKLCKTTKTHQRSSSSVSIASVASRGRPRERPM